MKLKKLFYFISFVCLTLLLAHFGKEHHRQFPLGDWRSELWADNAGYYIYLPATFIYNFDASKIPETYIKNSGLGFWPDSAGKIFTRYTYGVALAEAPFFLVNHLNQKIRGSSTDGFSETYNRCIDDAAAFYACLGIFTLILFLKKYYGTRAGILATITLFFGTGLYYYTIISPGMAHIYTFGLFGLYLLIAQKFISDPSQGKLISLFILTSIMILVRPTNALFASILFFIEINSWKEFITRLRLIFTVKNTLVLILILSVFMFPQCLYWHYISGKYIYYSYQEATFTNLFNPKIVEVLFSASNSLLFYGPVNIFILSSVLMYFNNPGWQNKMPLILLSIMIYLTASWFTWNFGCSYGARNLTEWLIIAAIPWAAFWKKLFQENDTVKIYFIALILVCVCWNLTLIRNFPGCWKGKGDWDYTHYYNLFYFY